MAQVTIQQAFDLALQHHRAGRLREAEQLYREILARQPEHADALHNLGLIALQVGRTDAAVDLIRRAVILKPSSAEAYTDLGIALRRTGRVDEAVAAYRQAIVLRPDYADAHSNLGNVLKDKGLLDGAIAAYRQAINLRPGYAETYGNLGHALKDKKDFDGAIAAYRRAIALKPGYAEAYSNLGGLLLDRGQLDEAIAAYRQAVAINPRLPEVLSNLGNALKDKGLLDEAIAAHRQAVALNPNLAEAHSNLGNVLKEKGQFDDAAAAYRQAIVLRPSFAEAHHNLGNTLNDIGEFDQAIAAYRNAIEIDPKFAGAYLNLGNALSAKGQLDAAIGAFGEAIAIDPEYGAAHHNRALALLARGDFQAGWAEYEWRWKRKANKSQVRSFTQPQWDGERFDSRTLLIHTEQGFGDVIQFIRYLPRVMKLGDEIVLECQPELHRLLKGFVGRCEMVPLGQPPGRFDLQCSLLSLPLVFGTTLGSIPNEMPYLAPEPELVEKWRERLGSAEGKLKVGLVWAGNPQFPMDRTRSMNLGLLAPLALVRGVQFFSLQKGPPGEQAKNPPGGLELVDLGPELKDFADTAAVMSQLDLVISSDTSSPHLAGALGRPVWVMLEIVPNFRWLRGREDSPWYPTMRLFRQSRMGDWDGVVGQVAEELGRFGAHAEAQRRGEENPRF